MVGNQAECTPKVTPIPLEAFVHGIRVAQVGTLQRQPSICGLDDLCWRLKTGRSLVLGPWRERMRLCSEQGRQAMLSL